MLNTDSLFLGGAAMADAGYYPLSKKMPRAYRRTAEAEDPKPGLLHYMAVSLPFQRIYTHGEYGIIERAKETVYNGAGPVIVRLPEKEPDNIEYLPPSWRHMMVREPSPLYNAYNPGELIIASVDHEYDTAALDELLSDLRANNPQFKASVMKKEPLNPQLAKKYGIKELDTTWEEYLDSKEFREYYQQRLARLFKEFRRRPHVPGFTGREKELADLDRAVQRFAFVNVGGGVGFGKSALLARLADKKESALTIAWIQAETRNISKAEVLVSLAIQLDLLSSPEVLEKENFETCLPQLEGDIEKKLREEEVLIIFDSLDPYLRQGRYVFKNQDLEDLLSRWVTERGVLGKSRLVFTADLRPDRRGEDSFKELKTVLSNAAGNREQKIILRELEDSLRWPLFLQWLKPLSGEADFQKKAYRLYKIEEKNLRLLRLLALWACEAGGMAKIEEDIKAVEETRPWNRENLVYGFLFKTAGSQKQVILKTLQWIGSPVLRSVICSSAGMAPALDELIAQGLVIPGPGNETVEPVYRFGGREERGTPLDKTGEQAAVREIRSFRRLIDISARDTARTAGFHRDGNSLCENTGFWDEWQGYALLNLSGFVSRAKFLVKQAKSPRLSPQEKQAMARRAMDYCLKSIAAGVELGDGHFFCAQAMALVYPNSHDQEIKARYETSIDIYPHAAKFGRYAIFLYKRFGDFEQAEIQFKKARQLEARRKWMNISGLHSQAEFYLHWRDHEKQAGDTINSIIGLKENKLQNFFLAARLFWEMGLRYSAAFFFETSLEIDEKNIQVLNSYAEANVEWGNRAKAVQLFERSLSVDSKHVPTLNSYANACVEWGDKAKAVQLFEDALKVQPENVQVLNSYANACVEWGDKGDKAKAVQLFERSLSVDSKHVPTLNSYANACVEWGDKAKAVQLFEKSLSVDPRHVPTLNSYANACVGWGDQAKAVQLFEAALKVQPENVQVLNSYANACVGWGNKDDKEKAVQLFEDALALQPENVQVLNSYANACVEWGDKGDQAKAVQLFEDALKVQPENVQVLNSYANACVEWSDKEKAVAFFDKALALEPRNEIVLTSYAKAQEKWGNKEKSREFLEKAKAVEKEKSAPKTASPPPLAAEIKEPAPETAAMTAKSEAPKTVPVPTIPTASAPAAAVPDAPVKEAPAPFTFTDREIAWLSNYDGKHRSWTGALDWAAFGMLYPLFYLSGELESAADLGYLPSMEREYLRLYHTVNDLYHIMSRAVYDQSDSVTPPESQHFSRKDDWFNREGKPLDLIAYFDGQMLRHAQNPVCAAFLCQALETYTWDNIAAIIRKEALGWITKDAKKWLPFMSKRTVNLFSAQGKEAFLTFLKEQAPGGEEAEPVTREAVSRFIDRFSIKWQDSFTYFPWEQLTPDERTRALDKLLSLVERVRDILKDLTEQKEGAFERLAKFVHQDIQVAVDLMGRLDEYQYQFNIPTPIPLHVSGEILEIKEDFLRVVIEHSGDEDYEKDIPRADFPEENPRVGQRFFAKIDKDRPDVVYGIDPLPYRKLTIDELIISLFGKEVYDKVSPYWEKEES